MTTFTPPTDLYLNLAEIDIRLRLGEEGRRAINLFRHYENLPRGRNVYKLANGTYVEDEPSDMTTVTKTYYGGHQYEVTTEEAADLTANGYGAYLT